MATKKLTANQERAMSDIKWRASLGEDCFLSVGQYKGCSTSTIKSLVMKGLIKVSINSGKTWVDKSSSYISFFFTGNPVYQCALNN